MRSATSNLTSRRGTVAMPRGTDRGGFLRSSRCGIISTTLRIIVPIATANSYIANGPRQRRYPPPNGMYSNGVGLRARMRSGRNWYGSGNKRPRPASSPVACGGTSITTATALASSSTRRSTAWLTRQAAASATTHNGFVSCGQRRLGHRRRARRGSRQAAASGQGVGGLPDGFTTKEPPPRLGGGSVMSLSPALAGGVSHTP